MPESINPAKRYRIAPGKRVNLEAFDPAETGPFREKPDAAAATKKQVNRLGDLQDHLYAENKRALLVILQGMDTSGKDGTIEHVFEAVDPQGCLVTAFKVPSANELAHDYLWRVHMAAPPRGMIGIFNRSHYESVLVERVLDLAPKSVWSRRYCHINEFERMLSDEGTTVVKFFLHISKDEQRRRLQERFDDPAKRWKFNVGDLDQRKRWKDYERAYEDALENCSTDYAPWYVIPADRKWYRNWAISEILVKTLEEMNPQFPKVKLPANIRIR